MFILCVISLGIKLVFTIIYVYLFVLPCSYNDVKNAVQPLILTLTPGTPSWPKGPVCPSSPARPGSPSRPGAPGTPGSPW